VANVLGCATADVRALVVEQKRLPAVYVTLVGAAGAYDYQLLKVNDEGYAFDLSVGGMESSLCTYRLLEGGACCFDAVHGVKPCTDCSASNRGVGTR